MTEQQLQPENTPETQSASMHEHLADTPRETENTLSEHLADLSETMQREKIPLSPEMKKYFDETLAGITDKMAKGVMPTRKELDEFINKVKSWIEAERLIKQVLDKSYDEMVDTLQNYGYTDKIPDKQTVMDAIRKLGPEMLENIRKFNRPTILMTPNATLKAMRKKLDANKKYSDSNSQQGDTYFERPPTDSLWNPASTKFTVSIVDGAPKMPQLPQDKVNLDNEHKHKYLTEEYKKLGMKMISARQYAMLAQKSLRSYEKTQDKNEIIDVNTITYLNAEHLTDLQKVPYANWYSDRRRFAFYWFNPDVQSDHMRGRPSVQVL